jgi:hypothetical protein
MLSEVLEKYGFKIGDEHILHDLQKSIEDKRKWESKCSEYNLDCGKTWRDISDEFRKTVKSAFQWFTDHYSALADHLKQFESDAKKRADKGDFWWEIRSCDYYDYFEGPKIVYPEIAMESRFAFDDSEAYPIKTIFTIPLNDKFLLAVLNSKLSFEYLKNTCSVLGDVDKRGRLLLQLIYLEKLPIPRIFFTTPKKERKEFFKEAVKLYKGSEYENILKWADHELALDRNDTVHDFLAYLAEQMIELNKAKGNEIKGFLKWLEREMGAEISALANKTAIKEYHDNDFNHLLDVLKKNKNKLTIDPSNRKTQELFEKHFAKSMTVLEPLKEKIQTTDELIDQIVYKLYNLTPEEIEVVERFKK